MKVLFISIDCGLQFDFVRDRCITLLTFSVKIRSLIIYVLFARAYKPGSGLSCSPLSRAIAKFFRQKTAAKNETINIFS